MTISVQLFAVARQLTGADRVQVELAENATVADLRRQLGQQHPQLAAIAGQFKFAVDEDYADDATRLTPESRVACIPPVSGG